MVTQLFSKIKINIKLRYRFLLEKFSFKTKLIYMYLEALSSNKKSDFYCFQII